MNDMANVVPSEPKNGPYIGAKSVELDVILHVELSLTFDSSSNSVPHPLLRRTLTHFNC